MKPSKFWIMSCTWGLLLTLFGAIAAGVLMATGHKPKRFHHLIYFEIGEKWGGFNMGPFFFVCKNCSEATKRHEAGHGIQNCMYGPAMPFIVTIPSVIRYWYREYMYKHAQHHKITDYDAIWFEGEATKLGDLYFKEVN